MNTLNSITNKNLKSAALRCRDFSIYRKVQNDVSIPHIMRTYGLQRKKIEEICNNAKAIEDKYKAQEDGVIRHPLDHDICHDLYLEIIGERQRPSRDENILFHPDFNGEDMTVSMRWTNKDIDHFCEQYIAQVATLLRSTKSESEVSELLDDLESPFFKAACKVAHYDAGQMVYLIKRKLKQYKS